MLEIDGSQGEGGGQILRTSLSLSLVTGRPFRIAGIRARRNKPGLLRQHLTAVKAAVDISGARVAGAELGSQTLTFEPAAIRGDDLQISIGSAGSVTLVLQTILPALLRAATPSRVTLEGGTHNPMAPPYDFVANAFVPALRQMGVSITVGLERFGFYPAGGGLMRVEVEPFGAHTHPAFFASLGAEARFRRDESGALRLTDGGNYLVDLYFPQGIDDPEALDLRINRRPGILENGLFIHLADHVLTASPGGVEVDSLGDVSL